MNKPSTPRYKLTAFKDGFTISGIDRQSTTMKIADNGLGFTVRAEGIEYSQLYGIPELNRIIHSIAGKLMMDWKSPKTGESYPISGWDIRWWAEGQTRIALAGRIKEQWLRLKEQMNPDVIALQNRMFSVNVRVPDWIMEEEDFYQHELIVGDIMKYRGACAVACRVRDAILSYSEWDKEPEPYWTALENWMGLYSPNGLAYPALRKTLMNLPGNFPPGPTQALRYIRLPEGITKYYKLLAMTVIGQETQNTDRYDRFIPVILRSTEEQFKEMLTFVGKNFDHWTAGPRTFKRFRLSMTTLMDYPADFGPINIMGLAKRSMKYHTDTRERRRLEDRQRALAGLEADTKTTQPPIPLLENKYIRFLETVEEVVDEGELMDHCVGSYAGYAVNGDSFLFHVDYKGEVATVELDKGGRVNQAHGVRNRNNKAVSYGTKVLKKWGSAFPQIEKHATLYAHDEIPF